MSDVQFMPPEYRFPDVRSSGFPIIENPTLCGMKDDDRSEFGQRLRKARLAAGLTQGALSKKCGLSQSSIAELEKSGQGSAATPMIAKALGVSAEWLASGKEEKATLVPWPFSHFTPQQFYRLDENYRRDIEYQLLGAITSMEQSSGGFHRLRANGGPGAGH